VLSRAAPRKIDPGRFPSIQAFVGHAGGRPKTQQALQAQFLVEFASEPTCRANMTPSCPWAGFDFAPLRRQDVVPQDRVIFFGASGSHTID